MFFICEVSEFLLPIQPNLQKNVWGTLLRVSYLLSVDKLGWPVGYVQWCNHYNSQIIMANTVYCSGWLIPGSLEPVYCIGWPIQYMCVVLAFPIHSFGQLCIVLEGQSHQYHSDTSSIAVVSAGQYTVFFSLYWIGPGNTSPRKKWY
jgi:hypothetical protein